jgi:hypothetical protein
MNLTEKQIRDFQSLYKRNFNVELNDVDAIRKAINLIELFKTILKC